MADSLNIVITSDYSQIKEAGKQLDNLAERGQKGVNVRFKMKTPTFKEEGKEAVRGFGKVMEAQVASLTKGMKFSPIATQAASLTKNLELLNRTNAKFLETLKVQQNLLTADARAWSRQVIAVQEGTSAVNKFNAGAERQKVILDAQLAAKKLEAKATAMSTFAYKDAIASQERSKAAIEALTAAHKKNSNAAGDTKNKVVQLTEAEKLQNEIDRQLVLAQEQLLRTQAKRSPAVAAINNQIKELNSSEKKLTEAEKQEVTTAKELERAQERLRQVRARQATEVTAVNRQTAELIAAGKTLTETEKLEAAIAKQLIAAQERLIQTRAKMSPEVVAVNQQTNELINSQKRLTEEEKRQAIADKALATAKERLWKVQANMSPEVLAITRQIEALSGSQSKTTTTTRQLTEEEKRQAAVAKELAAANERLLRAQAKMNPEVVAVNKKISALNDTHRRSVQGWNLGRQATTAFRAALQGLQANIGIYTSGTIVAAVASYKLAQSIKDTVKTGMDYTLEMSRVAAVSKANSAQMELLDKETRRLGASTQLTSTQVAEGLRELSMAGLTASESYTALEGVLKLSIIGMMDFGQAADIATNIMTGFNLTATDMTRIVDVMAQTATDSNTTIQQMGNALSYAAPVAEAFAVSLESTSAAIEVLANAGIKASRSGTALRRIITNLYEPTKKGAEALQELGVTVIDAFGKTRDFVDVLQDLGESTDFASKDIDKLRDIVGVRMLSAFIRLVKSTGDTKKSIEAVRESLMKASGAANLMSQQIADNLTGDFKQLQSAVEAVQLDIFGKINPQLREFVQILTAGVRRFLESEDAIRSLMNAVSSLAKIVGTLIGVSALSGLLKMLRNIVLMAGGVGAFFGDLKGILEGLVKTAIRTAAALFGVGAAVSILGGPKAIGSIIGMATAVAGVGTAAYFLTDDFKQLFNFLKSAWDKGEQDVKDYTAEIERLAQVGQEVSVDLVPKAKAYFEANKQIEIEAKRVEEYKAKLEELNNIYKTLGAEKAAPFAPDIAQAKELLASSEEKLLKLKMAQEAVNNSLLVEKKRLLETLAVRKQNLLVEQMLLFFRQQADYADIAETYGQGSAQAKTATQVMISFANSIGTTSRELQNLGTQTENVNKEIVVSNERLNSFNDQLRRVHEEGGALAGKTVQEFLKDIDELERTRPLTDAILNEEQLNKWKKRADDISAKIKTLREEFAGRETDQAFVNQITTLHGQLAEALEKEREYRVQNTKEAGRQAKAEDSINRKVLERLKLLHDMKLAIREMEILGEVKFPTMDEIMGDEAKAKKQMLESLKRLKDIEKQMETTGVSAEKLKEAMEEASFTKENYANQKAFREENEKLAAGFSDSYSAMLEYTDGMKKLDQAKKLGVLSAEDLAKAEFKLDVMRRRVYDTGNAVIDQLYEWADSALYLDKIGADWLGKFADAAADFATGAKDSFSDFFSYVKRSLIDLATRTFIVNVAGVLGFGPGSLGFGVGGAPAGLGAAGGAGGIGQSFLGLGSIISGFGKTVSTVTTGLTSLFSGGFLSQLGTGWGLASANMGIAGGGVAGYFGGMAPSLTFGASALGTGAWGAAIGAMAPYLLPIAAGITALVKILSDKTEPRLQLIAQGRRDVPTGFEDSIYVKTEFVDLGLGGKSHGVNAKDFVDILNSFQGIDKAIAEIIGETSVDKIRSSIEDAWNTKGDVLLDLGTFKLEGKSEEEIKQLFGDMAKTYYTNLFTVGKKAGDMFSKVMLGELEGVTGDFETVMSTIAEKVAAVGEAFKVLSDYMNSDLVADFNTEWEKTNRSMSETGRILDRDIRESIADFDGSLASLQKISNLVQERYTYEIQVLTFLRTAMKEIADTAANLKEQIALDVMTDEEQYRYYKGLAEDYYQKMLEATDPEEVKKFALAAMDAAGKAWGVVPDEIKAALKPGFDSFIDSLVVDSGLKLEDFESAFETDSERLRSQIADFMEQDREIAATTQQRLDEISGKLTDVINLGAQANEQDRNSDAVQQTQNQQQINTEQSIAVSTASTAALLQQLVVLTGASAYSQG